MDTDPVLVLQSRAGDDEDPSHHKEQKAEAPLGQARDVHGTQRHKTAPAHPRVASTIDNIIGHQATSSTSVSQKNEKDETQPHSRSYCCGPGEHPLKGDGAAMHQLKFSAKKHEAKQEYTLKKSGSLDRKIKIEGNAAVAQSSLGNPNKRLRTECQVKCASNTAAVKLATTIAAVESDDNDEPHTPGSCDASDDLDGSCGSSEIRRNNRNKDCTVRCIR